MITLRPIAAVIFLPAFLLLTGCESTTRIYSADRDEDAKGVVSGLDWRIGERIGRSQGAVDADGNLIDPPVDSEEALKIAGKTLDAIVKDRSEWKYGYCRVVNFQPGSYGWSVRFDRRTKVADAKAGDNFVKMYVLFDRTVVVPTTVYER